MENSNNSPTRKRRSKFAQATELVAGERLAEIQQVGGKAIIVVDPQRVVTEAEALAFSDITHVLVCSSIEQLRELPEQVRHAIKSVEQFQTHHGLPEIDPVTGQARYPVTKTKLRITMHEKLEALKMLAVITQAVKPPDHDDDKPAFTGFTLIVGDDKKTTEDGAP